MTITMVWKPVHKDVADMKLGRHIGIGTMSKEIFVSWDEVEGDRISIDICGHFWAFPRLKLEWVQNESEKHVPDEWASPYFAHT